MQTLYIEGMHGLGDNLHQRAILKELSKNNQIYLETSWPQVYWDLENINFISKGTNLRTQLKNQSLQESLYFDQDIVCDKHLKIFYKPDQVRRNKSVLLAMIESAHCINQDFSFRPKRDWVSKARALFQTAKPILIYRPLVVRKEWGGCNARNPDLNAYKTLFDEISKNFFLLFL